MYNNESGIGDALQECFEQGVKREEIFVATKLWISDRDKVEDALRASLQRLKLDYVDLYLMHFMLPDINKDTFEVKRNSLQEVWGEMERMKKLGLAKSIGVSNCPIITFLEILTFCEERPAINQVECHPYLVNADA
jgi:diketogulonate reductase-like aldo/keto reductase